MNNEKYNYRDKVNGQWISEPVEEQRILGFVTRGTLTPYDFVRKEGGGKPQMIRDTFPKAEEHWAMLRKIRVQLNRLWEAQLDDIMAIVSSGLMSKSGQKLRRCETSLKEFRQKFPLEEFKDEVKRLWKKNKDNEDNEEGQNFVQNEINYRRRSTDPLKFDIRPPRSGVKEGLLSEEDFSEKFSFLEKDLKEKNLNKNGVYVFYAGEEVTYVGEASNFGKRFKDHYGEQKHLANEYPPDTNPSDMEDEKWFLHDATKLELYELKPSAGTQSRSEFESLMIFHHGKPENNYKPRDNKKAGSSSAPVQVALKIVEAEIRELKSTSG